MSFRSFSQHFEFLLLEQFLIKKTKHLREKSGAECAMCIFRAKTRGRTHRDRQKLCGTIIVHILHDRIRGLLWCLVLLLTVYMGESC